MVALSLASALRSMGLAGRGQFDGPIYDASIPRVTRALFSVVSKG
jgi:hypothetical protein